MSNSTFYRAQVVVALCVLATFCGCSQFRAPEIDPGEQSLSDPFDIAVDAVRKGDLGFIKTSVESDSRYTKAVDSSGRTLLHYAAESGDSDMVSYLLEQGAHALVEDDDGRSPLDVSIMAVAPKGVIDILREATMREAGSS